MSWFNSGIDFNLPGNGGPDCVDFHSPKRRVFETSVGVGLCLMSLYLGWTNHIPPSISQTLVGRPSKRLESILKVLSISMTIVYLLEVGYKFITLQAIFSLNPCHCLCAVHIFLLMAPNFFSHVKGLARLSSYIFRIHLCFLHGPILAVIFPVTNTLFLPGEVAVYWLEHALLLIIPVVLLNVYTVPRLSISEWLNWVMMAYGIWGLFHWVFLQPLAIWTQANLNSMICPAITDPFSGPNYKVHAIWHQFVGNFVVGVAFYIFGVREQKLEGEVNGNDRQRMKMNGSATFMAGNGTGNGHS